MAVSDAVSVIGPVVECCAVADQLAAVSPVVDKRRDVAKRSDGKDVRLAFSQPFYAGFSS